MTVSQAVTTGEQALFLVGRLIGMADVAAGNCVHTGIPPDDCARCQARLALRAIRWQVGQQYAATAGEAPHDCLASVPPPLGGGSWIPDVTTWRCGCGQEWVWRRTGWERLVDAEPDVEEGRFDRAVLAASLAEAVSAVDAAARQLRAAWRNVGGDTGNLEQGAEDDG